MRQCNETANDDNYDAKVTAARSSSFTYYPGNNTGNTDPRQGLLETEVREPHNPALNNMHGVRSHNAHYKAEDGFRPLTSRP